MIKPIVFSTIMTSIEDITPAFAKQLLDAGPSSGLDRDLIESVKNRYREEMIAGNWKMNGESLQLDCYGLRLNGKHRLTACVEANVPFTSVVVRGLEPAVFDTIDIGRGRSQADILGMANIVNPRSMAAAAKWLISYLASGTIRFTPLRITPAMALAFCQANPVLADSIEIALKSKQFFPPGMGGALHFVFARKDRAAADLFFEDIAEGAALPKDDPVHLLRKVLLDEKLKSNSRSKLPQSELVARYIRAWNARREGLKLKFLRGIVSADGKRVFPDIL